VLVFLAFGSTAIQSWFGAAVNSFTGIAAFNSLIQELSGIDSQAVLLKLMMLIYRNGDSASCLRNLRIS
jgi:hypothetical protein